MNISSIIFMNKKLSLAKGNENLCHFEQILILPRVGKSISSVTCLVCSTSSSLLMEDQLHLAIEFGFGRVLFSFLLKQNKPKNPTKKLNTQTTRLGVLSLNGAEGLQQATSFAGISFGLKGIIHAVTQSTLNFQFVTVFPCLLPFVHQPN